MLDARWLAIVICSAAACAGDDGGGDGGSSDGTGSGPTTGDVSDDATDGQTSDAQDTTTTAADSTDGDSTNGDSTDGDSTDGGSTDGDSTDGDSTSSGDTTVGQSTGVPVEPEIAVSIDGVMIDSGATVALPDVVAVGAMGGTITVTVANVGDGDLTVTGVSAGAGDAAEFTIDETGLGATIEPDQDSSFDVSLAPSSGGRKSLTVTIDNDDADESSFELTLSGHTTPNAYRNLMPAAAPTARFNTALAYAGEGRVVLFGGRINNGDRVADTWVFDVETNTWTDAAPAAPVPVARDAHRLAQIDGAQLLLFGGNTAVGSGSPTAASDTWLYDADANAWTELMIPAPPARFQHMMVGLDGGALLFGGRTGVVGTDVGDTWVFNGLAQSWSNAAPAGAPSARSSSAMAWTGGDIVTLYGGFDSNTPISTSFNYSIVGNAWTGTGLVANPGARAVLEGAYLDAGRMLVFSGKLDSCCVNPTGGTFAYDPEAGQWAAVAATDEPPPRYNYGMAAVVGRNKAILFGGQTQNVGPGSAVNDTFELVGPLPDDG